MSDVLITENRDDVILNQYFKLKLRTYLDLTGVIAIKAFQIEPDGLETEHDTTIIQVNPGIVQIITQIKKY